LFNKYKTDKGIIMSVLVCSKSTKDFLQGFDRKKIISSPPDKSILDEMGSEESVVAIGGGAVIDTAKIICKNPIICYPTTASGSSETSWSVYWDGSNKISLKRFKPKKVEINSDYADLPERVKRDTTFDVISHFLDSLNSKKKTKKSETYCIDGLKLLRENNNILNLLQAGRLGGKAIEITGTNLLHSLSYPLTGYYGIAHGEALGFFLPKVSKFMGFNVDDLIKDYEIKLDIDIDFVIDEALKYDKIHEANIFINKSILRDVLC
tara:strand:+ start:1550 stop:2344 length:795 start_codon:yes stop_codon:yes gene_type:complete